MPIFELPISDGYVHNWGVREAVREILQNAADEHDHGRKMSIKDGSCIKGKSPAGHTDVVSVISEGASMSRESMLLGTSTKRGDDTARGQFGEGFKLAWLVLLREGKTVRTRVNYEIWTPFLERSANFGATVLKVDVVPATYVNHVAVEIGGISKEEWQEYKEMCLFLTPPKPVEMVATGNDKILRAGRFKGHIYAKGIFVCKQDELRFGYDLYDVELDRDRKMADPYSLKYAIGYALQRAVRDCVLDADLLDDLLNSECEEQQSLLSVFRYVRDKEDPLVAKAAEIFHNEYGKSAVPVSSHEEAVQAGQLGYRGVIVPRGFRQVLEVALGEFGSKAKEKELQAKEVYSRADLSVIEKRNLDWAITHVQAVEDWVTCGIVEVVDFHGSHVRGTYESHGEERTIRLKRDILSSLVDPNGGLLGTLAHEAAHRYGDDGSSEHRAAIQRILATIAVNLSGLNK